MTTFLICLAALIIAYFTYGWFLERTLGIKGDKEVPSKTMYDGVDYIPMPRWKTFLIQLLNIAGLGPIFGAVLGATYGPVAFLWITLGGIFMGAMHDFIAGVMSLNHNGASLPEIIGKYLGMTTKQVMRLFAVVMMILVGAVFMLGPAGILASMTGWDKSIWLYIVFAYYILATLLPIDKIIGNVYPIFGIALIFMALGILYVLFTGNLVIPDLTTFANAKPNASSFPIIPTMFITIACGAISGFHATQSPMMARCLKDRKESRSVFYGAMISESIIALIWAAAAMAFFRGFDGAEDSLAGLNAALAAHGNDASWAVNEITNTTLGKFGAILALLGVVAAPITSGDTAFRSSRLIIADFMGMEQRSILKRLYICIPMFAIGYAITLMNYDILWRYFAWANQTLAVFTLWAITVFLYLRSYRVLSGKPYYLISLLPAMFMTFICTDFLFTSGQMMGLEKNLGTILAGCATIVATVAVWLHMSHILKKGELA
ncbi:MAG: carbon starvation protein A [Bacteroidales bacterium]|jgi:carbon starvation protein CstA|nr:carbon starvation protein A [Bacteroidales bacterium]